MDRFRKRKDVTPVHSEPKKTNQGVASSIAATFSTLMGSSRNRSTSISSVSSATSASTVTRPIPSTSKGQTVGNLDMDAIRSGKMRDLVEVEIVLVDGEHLATHITEFEAHQYICRRSLKIARDKIYGLHLIRQAYPMVQIRLREKIDIDLLPPNFSYEKESFDADGKPRMQKVVCTVRGVRSGTQNFDTPRPRQVEDPNGPWIRWVKLEGVGFDLNTTILQNWLKTFGTLDSEFEKDVQKFADEVLDEDETDDGTPKMVEIATGKLSIKMTIHEAIPQFLPIYGKKIKVYYRGIEKLCNNCFEGGHFRNDCTNPKVMWIEYVSSFKDAFPQIDQVLYGRWNNTIATWKATQNKA